MVSPRILCAFAVLFLAGSIARADSFNFSFGSPSTSVFSGSGVLSGTQNADGSYLITGITGTTDTGNGVNRPIATLLPPGTFPTDSNGGSSPANDNLLFVDPFGNYSFDESGLSYQLRNGAQINLYLDNAEFLLRTNGNTVTERASITIVPTPEPSSLLLLGTGLVGVAAAARRRLAVL